MGHLVYFCYICKTDLHVYSRKEVDKISKCPECGAKQAWVDMRIAQDEKENVRKG